MRSFISEFEWMRNEEEQITGAQEVKSLTQVLMARRKVKQVKVAAMAP